MTHTFVNPARKPSSELLYSDHKLASSESPGVTLNVRERKLAGGATDVPLLLVHGATVASVLWDNPAPGWSWMDRLALEGRHVFALDLRGYGKSSRPDCFYSDPFLSAPYARAVDVLTDVVDAVDFILEQTGTDEVDLLGGSWGSIICGKLLAEMPARLPIRKLVLYAPLYQDNDVQRPNWLSAAAANDSFGAYRQVELCDLKARWDSEIPIADKSRWRPDGVFEAIAKSCIENDASYPWARPDSFRVPSGTLVDLEHTFSGCALYDARELAVPTLLVRGAADPISTNLDASRLLDRISAATKHYVSVGYGAHFMVGERVFPQVHRIVSGFLSQNI